MVLSWSPNEHSIMCCWCASLLGATRKSSSQGSSSSLSLEATPSSGPGDNFQSASPSPPQSTSPRARLWRESCLAEMSCLQPWAALRGQLKDRGPRWTQVCGQTAARPREGLHSQRSVSGSSPEAVSLKVSIPVWPDIYFLLFRTLCKFCLIVGMWVWLVKYSHYLAGIVLYFLFGELTYQKYVTLKIIFVNV